MIPFVSSVTANAACGGTERSIARYGMAEYPAFSISPRRSAYFLESASLWTSFHSRQNRAATSRPAASAFSDASRCAPSGSARARSASRGPRGISRSISSRASHQ